jgi:hypothetical protein
MINDGLDIGQTVAICYQCDTADKSC